MARIQIGTIGVDAGMCYLGDPCYVIDSALGKMDWSAFLDMLYASSDDGGDANWWVATGQTGRVSFPAGLVVTTGHGDGEYPVYAEIRDGRVASVTVQFMR